MNKTNGFHAKSLELTNWLAKHPEIAARFFEVKDLIDGAGGDIRNANVAEERAIEVLRGLGRDALTDWAGRVAEQTANEAQDSGRFVKHSKKSNMALNLRSTRAN